MEMFAFIICCISMVIGGMFLGSKLTEIRCEKIRKADHELAQRLINEQYDRGYKDGFMSKVTPNEIRKVMGFEPIKEENYGN